MRLFSSAFAMTLTRSSPFRLPSGLALWSYRHYVFQTNRHAAHALTKTSPLKTRAATRSITAVLSFSETTNMSTATAAETQASKRENAARAAERRLLGLQNTPTAPQSAASNGEGTCSYDGKHLRHDASGGGESHTYGGRKRGAPSASGDAGSNGRTQVGFSDSDGSDPEEVTFLGVSAGATGPGLGKGKSKDKSKDRGKNAHEGGDLGEDRRTKRGRINEAGMFTSAAPLTTTKQRGDAGEQIRDHGAPKTLRMVSWNIDCLNPENKFARVHEVCAILLEPQAHRLPDIILLQEVDADMMSILSARLGVGGRYRACPPRVPVESRYFTVVFVRVSTVTVQDSGREDFPGSRMGRDLTSVRCAFNGTPVLILTSHLESEKESSGERKKQFNQALRKVLSFSEGPAMFAGDTNLREAEVKQEKLAKGAGDMWQLCGADPELRFTWDMLKNDNHVFGGGFQPRARYDRMFVNPEAKTYAKSFALLGTERMAPPHSCFPSDHFGMDTRFEW